MASCLLLRYFVSAAMLLSVHGFTGFCNVQVAQESGISCECLAENQIYDYRLQDCVDTATLYPYGQCGPNAKDQGGNCTCDEGWQANSESGLCTEKKAMCPENFLCKPEEMCLDLPFKSYCECPEGMYRYSNTSCNTMNECDNPQWNDCPHTCLDEVKYYTCLCAEYFIDEDGDGRNCVVDSDKGYEDCSTEALVCVLDSNGEAVFNFSRGGYDDNGKDVDECAKLGDKTVCWVNSKCVNLEGGQGYTCQCNPGYSDAYFSTAVKECVLEEEPHCTGCECNDPCAGSGCLEDQICTATSLCSTGCSQLLSDAVVQAPLGVALYTGSVTVGLPLLDFYVNHMTVALESILGTEGVQVLGRDGDTFMFLVATMTSRLRNLTAGQVQGLVQQACLPLQESGLCELPAGVVTANDSISVHASESCTGLPCPYDEYECEDLHNGRYRCNCKHSGTGNYTWNFLETCEAVASTLTCATEPTSPPPTPTSATQGSLQTSTDGNPGCSPSTETNMPTSDKTPNPPQSTPDYDQINADLQTQLDDTEHSLTVTAAVLGTLLAVSVIALGVLIYMYMKK